MLKNISFLTAAAVLGASLFTSACVVTVGDDVSDDTSSDDGDDEATTDDGETEAGTDDGETDGTDDDVGTETDGETDGDTGTDESDTGAIIGMCGWDNNAGYYDCGFEGADPGGTNDIECPEGLEAGALCSDFGLSGVGCCDADGNNWYCGEEGDEEVVVLVECDPA
ncbi:hypothetical protein G6O69_10715 [Pseudenhygromyxa sp. WMMC2535]|uniref:hypothetical protein n=1 Tax=Pseudenhygromyxa sp. WMMC2535 TaxID=2712867 RepID=UPI00159588E2|nr:hypothetical protein [Pseudenhygromyxa sp. WMMC2535]NVB38304.1 hypothetical protein [Pseudenhygromyxa sp. WMMC2535]